VTPHDPALSALTQVPLALAKPLAIAEWSRFSEQPEEFSTMYCIQCCRMVGRDAGGFYFSHRVPFFRKPSQDIEIFPK